MDIRSILILFGLLLFPLNVIAANVDVRVTHVASSKGHTLAEICDKTTFLKKCPFTAKSPAVEGTTLVRFANVPAGDFAILVFHDENDDGRLNMSNLGIPLASLEGRQDISGRRNSRMPRS